MATMTTFLTFEDRTEVAAKQADLKKADRKVGPAVDERGA